MHFHEIQEVAAFNKGGEMNDPSAIILFQDWILNFVTFTVVLDLYSSDIPSWP